MTLEDDKRYWELQFKQMVHQKRKLVVDKEPERVYDRFSSLRSSLKTSVDKKEEKD